MKKLNIYLGDLMHNTVVKGPFIMPLNIGYVAAYAKKYFDKDINVRLFKFPVLLIDAIKEETPDILALSSYSWNADLDLKVIEFAKASSEQLITVLGGPNFPIDRDEQEEYLKRRPSLDFYVTNQGEPAFLSLLSRILESSGNKRKIKEKPINGCTFLSRDGAALLVGESTETFQSLNDIPSPYLSGILDEFFDANLIPIIETDRGCPYTCTFCAWGKTTNRDIRQFDLTRVKAEIDYIAKHNKLTDVLSIANANFGIFERDVEIATHIKQSSINSGYPRNVSAAWAKNTPDTIIKIAEILGDMVDVTMSFQSLTPRVLENIKRSNIKTSVSMQIRRHFAKKGISSNSEIILGLPGETKETHLDTLRTLFDINVANIVSYNCRMLSGTVLNTKQERKKYGIKTKHRLYDIGFGKYDNIISIEDDEIICSTNTLSEEEMLFFRPVHWLIQFLWSFKYYIQLLKYLQSEGIHPLDFILQVISDKKNAAAEVNKLLSDFEKDTRDEWFDTQKQLFDYYSADENLKMILEGGFGKLNYRYMFKVLCELRDGFDIYLAGEAKKMLDEKINGTAKVTAHNIVDNLIRYMRNRHIDFDDNLYFKKEKKANFDYDVIAWENDGYSRPITEYYHRAGIPYLFSITGEQRDVLINNILQYKHEDRNVTLRKMSEYIKKSDLFYQVSCISNQEESCCKTF